MIEDQSREPLITEHSSNMVVPKRKLTKLFKIGGAICVVAVIIILATAFATGGSISTSIVSIVHFKQEHSLLALENVRYDKHRNILTFTDNDLSQNYLNMHFPHVLINSDKVSYECSESESDNRHFDRDLPKCSQLNLEFENDLHAVISEADVDGMQCHSVQLHSNNKSTEITNCFTLEDNWYGGGGLSIQRWPLNRVSVASQPHITQKLKLGFRNEEANFDSFLEPYFVSAKGTAILFEHYLPLFISMNNNNDRKLCFTSAFKKPYASVSLEEKLLMNYLVCKERTAKSVHQRLLKTKIPLYHGSPQTDILRKPIWSTRGIDVVDINEAKVVSLVQDIKSSKLFCGHLFIDGNYSRSKGNFYFNEKTFPHSHQLIMELNAPKDEKLPIGTEVYPHIPNHEYKLFAIQYRNNSLLKKDEDQTYFLDVTNEEALNSYKIHLRDLTEQISLKGFRFSGGYAMDIIKDLDQSFLITNKTLHNPNVFTKRFAEVASDFKETVILGSGYDSQSHTFIADAGPMISSWEHNKGLKSIIPTVLTYGIMGYPFGLMGPIGGVNIADDSLSGHLKPPDKELYLRWLQLAIYLPVIELSVGPWVYGQEVVNYTQSLLSFRYNKLWPKFLSSAMEEAVRIGTPIARPLWWIFPEDKTAQFIDCEFFLGNSLLVAPVLYDNLRYRDIYLPEGSWWRDQLRGDLLKGGQWLKKYKVGLYEIATFIRDVNPRT